MNEQSLSRRGLIASAAGAAVLTATGARAAAPATLPLSITIGSYEIFRALKEGEVQIDGVTPTFLMETTHRDRHWSLERNMECDVGEFNFCGYLMARDRGYARTALPIYPHRRFRHGFIFINPQRDIKQPSDLVGRRIGCPGFTHAALVWLRGILEDEYGVGYRQVTWVATPHEDIPFTPPKDIKVERVPDGVDFEELLMTGKIDALITPSFPDALLKGDPRIGRLIANPREAEEAYYRKTGIFPIMHILTLRQDLVDKHPWLPGNLSNAFQKSKLLAYERLQNPRVLPMAFATTEWEEQQKLLGPDPWSYGLTPANVKNLETARRYCFNQGLIKKEVPLKEHIIDIPRNVFRGTPEF